MILAINKQVHRDYHVLEKLEAGIKLTGQEVKSAKSKNISLKGSYVAINFTGPKKQPEVWLINAHISAYKFAGKLKDYDPTRSRKLLIKRQEIDSLLGKTKQKSLTLVPLLIYTRKGKIKVEIGICRGKKLFDKRQDIKKHEETRHMQRLLRQKI